MLDTNALLAIHAGAGAMDKKDSSKYQLEEIHESLKHCLQIGHKSLKAKAHAIDIVQATVEALEDCPLFNAGRGSVFNNQGKIEMDASLMDGQTLKAGTVSCLKQTKNPIKLARAIMDKTNHVAFTGAEAEELAKKWGIEQESLDYFKTAKRFEQFCRAKSKVDVSLDHQESDRHGTVGAVALDTHGNLAAATSTGGMTNKMAGRVSDSSQIGAGNYADNETCAVSCTGVGEIFIRTVAAYRLSAIIKYGKMSLEDAGSETLKIIGQLGGTGGLIAIDSKGTLIMPFNSSAMLRGCISYSGKMQTQIFRDL